MERQPELLGYGRQPAKAWRAPPRAWLLVVLSVAAGVLLALFVYFVYFGWWHGRPVRQVKAGLARVQNAVVLDMYDTDHGGYTSPAIVQTVSLHVAGRPDALIELCGVKPDAFADTSHLYLYGLGGNSFRIQRAGQRGIDDYIDIGAGGEFAHLIPFEVRSVQDVIDRYDELVKIVESWPRDPEWGTLADDPGRGRQFTLKRSR